MAEKQYYPFIYKNGTFKYVIPHVMLKVLSNVIVTSDNLVFTLSNGDIFITADAAAAMSSMVRNTVNNEDENYILQFIPFKAHIFSDGIEGIVLIDNHGRILTNNQGKILIK